MQGIGNIIHSNLWTSLLWMIGFHFRILDVNVLEQISLGISGYFKEEKKQRICICSVK